MRPSRLLALLPPVVLLSAAVTLWALWSRIPPRWVSHMGIDGRPNGWTEKTPMSAGLLLLIGAGVWLSTEAALWFRRTHSPADEPSTGAMVSTRLCILLVVGLFSYFSIALPLAETGLSKTATVISVLITVGCSLVALLVAAVTQRPPRSPAEAQKLWWPKASGLGYTLNFSHPMAIPVLVATGAAAVFILWLGHRLTH